MMADRPWHRHCASPRPACRVVGEEEGMGATVATLALLVCLVSAPGVVAAGVNRWTGHGPEGGGVFSLAVDPLTPTTVYAGTNGGGVFKSVDAGAHWNPASTGLMTSVVVALAIDPATPTTLYAATAGGGVFKTTDAGAHWSAVNTGLTSLIVHSLLIDRTPPPTASPAPHHRT